MRNRVILGLPLILGSCALAADQAADEAADRAAISRTIAALNQVPQPAGLFTDDAVSELGRLPEMSAVQFQPNATVTIVVGPGLVISHEPWGEAEIYMPGLPRAVMVSPRIASGTVRFVTPDVATVEGSYTRWDGDSVQTTPLLFLMKRDGNVWKIASVRLLASN